MFSERYKSKWNPACRVLFLHHWSVFSHNFFWGLGCHVSWSVFAFSSIFGNLGLTKYNSQYSRPKPHDCMSHVTTCCSFTKSQKLWISDLTEQISIPNLQSASFYLTKLTPPSGISHRDRRAWVFPKSHWSNQWAGTSVTNSPVWGLGKFLNHPI